MYEGLNKIVWGIFLATFSINLVFIRFLPTFIGFMVISSGINTIYTDHHGEEFKKSLHFSRIVVVIALFGELIDFFTQGAYQYSLLLQIWPIILMLAELLMFYYLFIGIIKYFDSIRNLEVSERLIASSRLYMIIFITNTAFLSFVLLFNLGALSTWLTVVFVILRISLMIIISGIKKDLIPKHPEDDQGIEL